MDGFLPNRLDDLNTCTQIFDWSMTAGQYDKNQSLDWNNHDWFRFCYLIPFVSPNQSMDCPSVLEWSVTVRAGRLLPW